MFDFLDRLREKSPSERMFIAVATSASLTALITIVWMISFGVTLSRTKAPEVLESASVDALKRQIDDTFSESQKVFESLNNIGQTLGTTSASSTAGSSTAAVGTSSIEAPVKVQQSAAPRVASTTNQVEIIGP